MSASSRLTDAELAELRRRRPAVRASLACEGLVLSADEERLIEQMDRERLKGEDRIQRALQFDRERRGVLTTKATG